MKIGRAALDDDAIRLIEELNPFVEFDWPRIIKGQDQPPSEVRVPVEVRRQKGPRSPDRSERQDRSERPERSEPRSESRSEPAPDPRRQRRETPAETAPAEVAEFTDASQADAQPAADPIPDVIVAAHAKIGADGVARLRARYAEIAARIGERVADPERREALHAQAKRLSPDAWTTEADVVQALDEYESVLASLREVVGRKRRRRRRGGSRAEGASDGGEVGSSEDPGLEGSEERDLVSSDTQAPAEDAQTTESRNTSESREEPEDTGL